MGEALIKLAPFYFVAKESEKRLISMELLLYCWLRELLYDSIRVGDLV